MYKKIILSILFFTSINVSAGIFGASNYEECVLDKMKGQTNSMRGIANDACEIAFPIEKILLNGMWDIYESNYANITYEFSQLTKDSIEINFKNESKYKVTRLLIKTMTNCDKTTPVLETVNANTSMNSSKVVVKVADAREIKCLNIIFHGKRIK